MLLSAAGELNIFTPFPFLQLYENIIRSKTEINEILISLIFYTSYAIQPNKLSIVFI